MGSGFIFSQQAIVSCGDKINPDPFHYPKFQPQRKLIVTAYDSFFTIQCHKRTGFQNLCCIFCPDQYRKIKAQSALSFSMIRPDARRICSIISLEVSLATMMSPSLNFSFNSSGDEITQRFAAALLSVRPFPCIRI